MLSGWRRIAVLLHMVLGVVLMGSTDASAEPALLDLGTAVPAVEGDWVVVLDGTVVVGRGDGAAAGDAVVEGLDHPARLTAAAARGSTAVIAGGLDTDGNPHARVHRLDRSDSGEIAATRLPDLPVPLAGAGVGFLNDTAFVVGGGTGRRLQPSPQTYTLDLTNPSAGWDASRPPLPGGALRPAVLGLYDQINVVGGFDGTLGADGAADALEPSRDVWAYRDTPVAGTQDRGWLPRTALPEAHAGGALVATGSAHALLVGGSASPFAAGLSVRGVVAGDPVSGDPVPARLLHLITDTALAVGPSPMSGAVAADFDRDTQTLRVWELKRQASLDDAVDPTRPSRRAAAATLTYSGPALSVVDYAVVVLYFMGMAGVGMYFACRQKTGDDFSLGGRTTRWWAAGISMFATGASSISFMAIPAVVFGSSLVWFAYVAVFMVPAYFLQAHYIYPLLRRLRLTSTFAYLEQRFDKSLRMIASVQAIAFQLLGRMAVVMLLPALAIQAVTGLDIYLSVTLMGVLTTAYTTLGGFAAVIWTDVIQGLMMLVGCVLMIVLAVVSLPGGFGEFAATSTDYGKFDWALWGTDFTTPLFLGLGLVLLVQQLGFAADQPVVQRVYATPLRDVRKLAATNAVCSVLIAGLVCLTGVAMFAYFHAFPGELNPTMAFDHIVPHYVMVRLPPALAGLIIAAIFAASMSTLSSSMNSVATLVGEDFYRRWRPDASDRSRLRVMQAASIAAGAVGTGTALYMASLDLTSMFKTWNEVIALLGGGILGVYILGMFTTRTNAAGATVGAVGSIVAGFWLKSAAPIHYIFYTPALVLLCVVLGYLSSLCLPSRPRDLAGLTVFTPLDGEVEQAA